MKDIVKAQIQHNLYNKDGYVINVYSVIDSSHQKYKETFIGKGKNLNITPNLTVELEGFWNSYRNEEQFSINEEKVCPVNNEKAFTAYLIVQYKGVGVKTAEKLLKKFGPNYEILSNKSLLETVVSKKIAQNIYDQTLVLEKNQEVFNFFAKLDLLTNSKRIALSEKLDLDTILSNPFILKKKDNFSLSFVKINKICLFAQDDERIKKVLKSDERIKEGIVYNLTDLLFQRGHTWIDSTVLINEVINYLNSGIKDPSCHVSEKEVKKLLNVLNKEHIIKAEKFGDVIRVYNAFFYDCENSIAKECINKIYNNTEIIPNIEIDKTINSFEKQEGITLSDNQKLAIRGIVNNPLCVITGSAGTGKTTVLNFAIKTLMKLRPGEITLAAPTGRAARRMAQSTGLNASTLHHLLGISNEGDSVIPVATKKVETDYIFIDETSMCDIAIIHMLIQQCSKNTRYIFIGDPNQLPSVGAGNVLDDLIKSNCVPVIKLKYIYRQSGDSNIIINANNILQSSSEMKTGDDFVLIEEANSEKISEMVVKNYIQEVNNNKDILEVQVITPKRRDGELSAYSLNQKIQEKINPHVSGCFELKANGYTFRGGDKVTCCKNTKTVKNGDIGFITQIYKLEHSFGMTVQFDEYLEDFDQDTVKDLNFALAHAITVHKSQGSEFKSVIMPINIENRNMLKRNLFYTAITRARNKMILIGDKQEIGRAVSNNTTYHRNTLLRARIRKFNNDKQKHNN